MNQSLFFFIFGMVFVVSDGNYHCKPYDPEPANNVDVEKVQGTWYGLHFRSEQTPSPCNSGADAFAISLKLMDYKTMESRESRRPLNNKQTCLTATDISKITSNPAKWKFQQYNQFGNRTVDFRILDTDYKNYLVRWTCGKEDKWGKCVDFLVAIWGRKSTPFLSPSHIFNKVSKIVKDKMCLDFNTFSTLSFQNVCPLPARQIHNKRRY